MSDHAPAPTQSPLRPVKFTVLIIQMASVSSRIELMYMMGRVLRVRIRAAVYSCSMTRAIGRIERSLNPVELSSLSRPSAPMMSPITNSVTGGM